MTQFDDWVLTRADRLAELMWDAWGIRVRSVATVALMMWCATLALREAWGAFLVSLFAVGLRLSFTPVAALIAQSRCGLFDRIIRAYAVVQVFLTIALSASGASQPTAYVAGAICWAVFAILHYALTPNRPRRRKEPKVVANLAWGAA